MLPNVFELAVQISGEWAGVLAGILGKLPGPYPGNILCQCPTVPSVPGRLSAAVPAFKLGMRPVTLLAECDCKRAPPQPGWCVWIRPGSCRSCCEHAAPSEPLSPTA